MCIHFSTTPEWHAEKISIKPERQTTFNIYNHELHLSSAEHEITSKRGRDRYPQCWIRERQVLLHWRHRWLLFDLGIIMVENWRNLFFHAELWKYLLSYGLQGILTRFFMVWITSFPNRCHCFDVSTTNANAMTTKEDTLCIFPNIPRTQSKQRWLKSWETKVAKREIATQTIVGGKLSKNCPGLSRKKT